MNRTNEKAAGVLDTLATAKEKTQADSNATCTKCRDNFPMPVAADYFDQRVIADYTQRRTACTAVPDAEKPCIKPAPATATSALLAEQVRQLVVPVDVAKHGRPQTKGFAAATAALTGESVRSIQRHIARADALGGDLQRVIGTSLDKGMELDALVKLPAAERTNLIERAQAGEKVSAVAILKNTKDDEFFTVTVKAKTLSEFRRKLRNVLAIVEFHLEK